jgi:hypothetical protein
MGRGLVVALAVGALFVAGAAPASAACEPGAPLENDPIANVPHPEQTVDPIVIGCWRLDYGRIEVHGRRMKAGRQDQDLLCLGTQRKVVCADRWPPPKGEVLAGSACGGGSGLVYVEGTVTERVKRVDVRYRDRSGKRRSRRASIVWLRGGVAKTLKTRAFGYYRSQTMDGEVIDAIARDRDGKAIARIKQTGCNRPR